MTSIKIRDSFFFLKIKTNEKPKQNQKYYQVYK